MGYCGAVGCAVGIAYPVRGTKRRERSLPQASGRAWGK